MYRHQRSGEGEGRMMQERRSPFTLSGPRFVIVCCLVTSNTVLLLGFGRKKSRMRVVILVTKGRTTWFEFLVVFYCFIMVKKEVVSCVKTALQFKGKIGQMCHRSCTCVKGSLQIVQKIGHFGIFNLACEFSFPSVNLRNMSMKLGALIHHVPGYKSCLNFFIFQFVQFLSFGVSKSDTQGWLITKLWKIIKLVLGHEKVNILWHNFVEHSSFWWFSENIFFASGDSLKT